jgi:hypothetical protein
VDDPVEATHGGQICGERGGIGQIGEITEKAEILCLKGRLQAFEKKSAEQPGKRLDGEKKVRAPLDPSRTVKLIFNSCCPNASSKLLILLVRAGDFEKM